MDASMLLYYLSGFPKEMAFALLAFLIPLRRREKWIGRGVISIIGVLAAIPIGFLIWQIVDPGPLGALFFALYYLLICLTYMAGIRFTFEASWNEALYCVVCGYIIEHLVYCVGNLLVLIPVVKPIADAWWWSLIVHLLIYAPMYFLYARRMCRDGHYATSSVRSAWMMATVFLLVYVLSVKAIDMELEWFHACYALICLGAMLISEYRAARYLWAQEDFQSKEHLWAMNKAQYEMTTEHIDTINRKCHDLKHQINALRAMDDQSLRSEAIHSMEEAVMIYDSTYQTGSHTLDMVLTQKALRCSQLNIPLSVIADGGLLNFMDDIDLYTMMANILDNAMEANEQINDPEARTITLSVHERKGLIILQAENPYTGDIKLQNGLPLTHKADKDSHGFGTKSIVYTVEKYHGFLNIETKNQMFVLRVVFSLENA